MKEFIKQRIRESLLDRETNEFYHGSPYVFDKFNFDKIGTGDGLNKYGYGLYFTNTIDTAKWYAKELSIGKNRATGFNIYTVKLLGLDQFYQWEGDVSEIQDSIIRKLISMGKEEEANQIASEYEEYDTAWSMKNMYEFLTHVLGGKKETSEFLNSVGVNGVIVKSVIHGDKIYVAYSDNIIKIISMDKGLNENAVLDEDYPASWSLEEFKKLTSYQQRIKYCETHLQRLGSGSSRIVYKIDDEKVLKLAKNKKGLAQNDVEATYSSYHDISDIVARVFDYDDNDLWVEMELARKLTPSIFKTITGFDFKDYCATLNNHYTEINPQKRGYKMSVDPAISKAMWEQEFTYDMLSFVGGYDIPTGDLCRVSSYGVVHRNGSDQVVLVDFGLNDAVSKDHYSR